VHARDAKGRCPLHLACAYGTEGDVVVALLRAGADPTLTDDDGERAAVPLCSPSRPSLMIRACGRLSLSLSLCMVARVGWGL
jgi:ankyrin repeat protein